MRNLLIGIVLGFIIAKAGGVSGVAKIGDRIVDKAGAQVEDLAR